MSVMYRRLLVLAVSASVAAFTMIASPAQAQSTAHQSVAPRLNLELKSTVDPVSATWISLAGHASKTLAGDRLVLERKAPGKRWTRFGSVRVGEHGSFAIKTRATGVGVNGYRVRLPATKYRSTTTSNSLSVTVWKWYYLSNFTAVNVGYDTYAQTTGPLAMGGQTYYHTIDERADLLPNDMDYNTSYKCKTFAATIGISDDAPVDETSHFEFMADGVTLQTADPKVGITTTMTADISGIFRIGLQTTMDGSDNQVMSGWGNAGVLCKATPQTSNQN